MKQKGIIFDLDGVILSTDTFHYQAWKRVADQYGVYFDEKINHRLRGVSRMESLEIILESHQGTPFSTAEKETIAEEKNTIYKELLKTLTPEDVSDEVIDTLKQLKTRGFQLAIGSSSKNAKYILSLTNTATLFDAVSDGTNITHSKPHPEVFDKAAQFLGCSNDECVVIEDAVAGIEAAVAANMVAIGIGDAAGYSKNDYSIHRFAELLKILPHRVS